jgi:undecaprenyl-diphosphatase
VVDRIIEFLQPFLTPPWGYLVVALATFLENSVGAGVIVPGETIVLLGGVYASEVGHPPLFLPGVMVAAFLGAVIGDNIGYWLGRRYGRGLLERHGHRLRISDERLAKADEYYRSHGGKTVFLGRFIPFVRSVGFILAGVSKMPWKRFIVYDAAGAALWSFGHAMLGYLAGASYQRWEPYATPVGLAILVVLVLLIGGSKFVSSRRSKKAEARRA